MLRAAPGCRAFVVDAAAAAAATAVPPARRFVRPVGSLGTRKKI